MQTQDQINTITAQNLQNAIDAVWVKLSPLQEELENKLMSSDDKVFIYQPLQNLYDTLVNIKNGDFTLPI